MCQSMANRSKWSHTKRGCIIGCMTGIFNAALASRPSASSYAVALCATVKVSQLMTGHITLLKEDPIMSSERSDQPAGKA